MVREPSNDSRGFTDSTRSAAGLALQRSHWPDVLRSDSARNHGVRKDIIILTKISSLLGILVAIAGVVTPLGLHEALLPADNEEVSQLNSTPDHVLNPGADSIFIP